MNTKTKKRMIKHLRALASSELQPIFKEYGICTELAQTFELKGLISVNLVSKHAESWKEYSSKPTFPVPDSVLGPECSYHMLDNLWDIDTEYGRSRRRLCLHIAHCLEQELATSYTKTTVHILTAVMLGSSVVAVVTGLGYFFGHIIGSFIGGI